MGVSVPEAPVHKYYDIVLWEDNVRLAGKISSVQPEPISHPMEN